MFVHDIPALLDLHGLQLGHKVDVHVGGLLHRCDFLCTPWLAQVQVLEVAVGGAGRTPDQQVGTTAID